MIDNHSVYMRRKWYLAYDWLKKLQKSIEDNLDEALDVLLLTPRRKGQKYPRSVETEVPKSKFLPQPYHQLLLQAMRVENLQCRVSVSSVKFSYHSVKSIR